MTEKNQIRLQKVIQPLFCQQISYLAILKSQTENAEGNTDLKKKYAVIWAVFFIARYNFDKLQSYQISLRK